MNLDIPFGEWLPDLADLSNPGVTIAKNVMPHLESYRSMPALSVTTDALTAACQGAVAYSDKDGNSEVYAGDAGKLYRLATDTWEDKSGTAYSTAASGFWRFTKWGEKVIATNGVDPVQIKDFGTAGSFAALSGSPPVAKHISTVRSFVVLGDVNDGTRYPNKVQWSGQNLETSWGSVPATQADSQVLTGDGGAVQAIAGGDVGVIVQERSIWEMRYEGPPIIFRFDETAPGIGTSAPRSVTRFGSSVFFFGNDGFYRYDVGAGAQRIGDKKVDNWFLARVNRALLSQMVGAIDYANSKVVWAYPTGATSLQNDELLIYDWSIGRWSYVETATETIYAGRSVAYTLEGLDSVSASLDALASSLDAFEWQGGALSLWGFDTTHKAGAFGGAAMDATIETAEVGTPDAGMIYVNGMVPLIDGSTTNTVYVASRNTQNADYSYGAGIAANSIGEHNTRTAARYLRFKVDTSGEFNHAKGVRARIRNNGIR